MFDSLKNRLDGFFNNVGKKIVLQEKDLDEILREIRIILLEADVSLNVVRYLLDQLKNDLIGKEYYKSISPRQLIYKSLHDVLHNFLVSDDKNQELAMQATTYYTLLGLQGAGKTTTAAKLAYHLKEQHKKDVLLVPLDLNRPAAYEQLQKLSQQIAVDFFEHQREDLQTILKNLQQYVAKKSYDIVIIDTAGRLAIDDELMQELATVHRIIQPKESLLVMDSMVGQSALSVAKEFNDKIQLSGIIATKLDADARGGAILSCKYETNVPIKCLGVGEKIHQFELFDANKIVNNILNSGDVQELIQQFSDITSNEENELEATIKKGKFTLIEYKKQLKMLNKFGGMSSMFAMLPGALSSKIKNQNLDTQQKTVKKQLAMIDSMTILERQRPSIINFSRKKRITAGSGTTIQDLNILLNQFEQMQKMMKKFSGKDMDAKKMLSSFKGGDLASIFGKKR